MNGCSGDTLEEEHRESNIFEDYLSFTREMQHGRFTGRLRPWDCVLVLSYMYFLFRDRDKRQEITASCLIKLMRQRGTISYPTFSTSTSFAKLSRKQNCALEKCMYNHNKTLHTPETLISRSYSYLQHHSCLIHHRMIGDYWRNYNYREKNEAKNDNKFNVCSPKTANIRFSGSF